jgi:tetratricopeptide (TPR) repeat protein
MPKRSRTHQIEDISRAEFQLKLPESWVLREKGKDYGIDAEVELFDENNQATGLIFWVQLKATEANKEKEKLSVSLKIDTLNYYKKLSIPVILVRYLVEEKKFYYKWVNNVDLFFAKKSAKTHKITFDESNLWNEFTANEIKLKLAKIKMLKEGNFRFPLGIKVEIGSEVVNGHNKIQLFPKIRKALKEYKSVVYFEEGSRKVAVYIKLNVNELEINGNGIFGSTYHNVQDRSQENFVEDIVKDIILGIALGMIQIRQLEHCARIIFENKLEQRIKEKDDLLEYVIPPLLQSSYFEKALTFISSILKDSSNFRIDLITKVFVALSAEESPEKTAAIEKFLIANMESEKSTKSKQQLGIAHYNLANHYHNRGRSFEAVKHYLLAKRNAPIYLKQHYYFSELAGSLFHLQKYKVSAKFYEKALELKANNSYKALSADALMFGGQYERAKKLFDEYLKDEENPAPEYILKSICLGKLFFDNMDLKDQIRNKEKAMNLAFIEGDEEDKKGALLKVLDSDLLCELAWFNLGVYYATEHSYYQSTFAFIMAGICQTADVEAWVNATLSSFNEKETLMVLPLIVKTAYFFNREDYLEKLYERIIEQRLPDKEKLAEAIDEIIKEERSAVKKSTIRYLDENEVFQDLY